LPNRNIEISDMRFFMIGEDLDYNLKPNINNDSNSVRHLNKRNANFETRLPPLNKVT